MLKKFVAIKNVGTFRNAPAAGDVELRRMTLIHADNGRGKTTLCAILRSLKTSDANLILERKTLDGAVTDFPQVKILFDTGTSEFSAGAWAHNGSPVEIFDATFIAENVYSGDEITHEHKKNLCRVVLGTEGVKLAKTFDDLDAEVRAAGNVLNEAKDKATKLVPPGMTLDEFIKLPADPDIDNKIEGKKGEIVVLNDAAAIKSHAKLVAITLPQPPGNLTEMLLKTVEGISAEAVARVRAHVNGHKMEGRGEAWLAEGLRYVATDCPFCAQPLVASPVLDTLGVFFSAGYRNFQTELATLRRAAETALSDASLLNIQKILSETILAVEFWKKFVDAAAPALSFDDQIKPVISRLRNALLPLVAQKVASPLDRVEYTPEAREVIRDWTALRDEVVKYNEGVAVFNATIDKVKLGLDTKHMGVLNAELARLEAQKRRHEPATLLVLAAYLAAAEAKLRKENEKDAAKAALEAYNATVVDTYKDSVNELLQRFGAAFSLSKVKVEYQGRTPRAGYSFVIRGKEVDPGGGTTPAGSPQFRNTLSSGDRSTLALAFFMAQLKHRGDIAAHVVVFDDPFTSLDGFRQNYTCSAIRNISRKAKQVIVLSHSLEFLRLLAGKCDQATLKTLRIDQQNNLDSHIIELDLADAVAPAADKDAIQLRSFFHGDDRDSLKTIRCIRPLLEHYIRKIAPHECPAGNGWLGTFIAAIRNAVAGSSLVPLQGIVDDLDHLNNYTSPYAHDSGNQPTINDTELKTMAELTLKMIGRF